MVIMITIVIVRIGYNKRKYKIVNNDDNNKIVNLKIFVK
jgi:hypothetical protein